MNGRTGIPLVLAAGALIVLGVSWAAGTQKEVFLGNQIEDSPAVGSDVTILTAFFVGLGVTLAFVALGTASLRYRIPAALVGGIAAWLLMFLVQASWPNYTVIPEFGFATVSQSNLLRESAGAPSVLLPVLALGILLLIGIGWGIIRSGAMPTWSLDLSIIRRDHLAIAALAIPVLIVTASGLVRVMLELPPDTAAMGLTTILMPLGAIACVLLAVTIVLRMRHVARLRHDPSLVEETRDAWQALDRVDLAGIVSLGVVAALSSFLSSDPADITSSARTLLFTPRSHGQAVIFLAVVLLPLHLLHRHIRGLLGAAPNRPVVASRAAKRSAVMFTIVTGTACVLATVLTFATDLALIPWVVGLVPPAIVAGIIARPLPTSLVRVVAAWVLWAKGNTIEATYQANTFPDLAFGVHPGILALWRMAAAAMIAWVVYDILHDAAWEEKSHVAVPLSLSAAVGTALVGLLYLPLNVWAEATLPANKVAVGSLLLSQQNGVQVVMHIISVFGGLGAMVSMARILRPDWFRRRPGEPTPTPLPAVTPG